MPTSRPRILCLTPNWLGDAVLALPALAQLRDADVDVELVSRRGTTRVFADAIGAGVIHEVPRARLQRFAHAWGLRQRRFGAAVVLPPSWSSAVVAWMSGARRRVGERRAARGALLTHALAPAGRATHLALAYQRVVRTALDEMAVASPGASTEPHASESGVPAGLYAPATLQVHADEIAAGETLLRGCDIDVAGALVLAPGARYGQAKRYPLERFARVGGQLSQRLDGCCVVVGGQGDRQVTAALSARLPGSVDLGARTDMGTLLGILARARAVVSNDSGVMHLAAALGAPVVGIFGSTNPNWTRPLGPCAGWVSNPVPCAPCYRRTCPIDFPCMLGLDPQVIVDKVLALVAAASRWIHPSRAPL